MWMLFAIAAVVSVAFGAFAWYEAVCAPGQLGSALGPDLIKMLAQRSGMSPDQARRRPVTAL